MASSNYHVEKENQKFTLNLHVHAQKGDREGLCFDQHQIKFQITASKQVLALHNSTEVWSFFYDVLCDFPAEDLYGMFWFMTTWVLYLINSIDYFNIVFT